MTKLSEPKDTNSLPSSVSYDQQLGKPTQSKPLQSNPVILVTNDDSVYATGIRAAYESLRDLGDVVVVAPATQQSGVGRSISIFEPLRMHELDVEGMPVHAVSGTPADSTVLGIFSVLKQLPDLLVSGFNIGENLSTDTTTTSGTVGAALEAASYGIPTIAASMQVLDEGDKFDNLSTFENDFYVGMKVLRRICEKVLEHGLPEGVDLLNINIPHHVTEETPIEFVRLARKIYNTKVQKRKDPRGRSYYQIDGDRIKDDEEGTDVCGLYVKQHITITPMSLDCTSQVDFSILGHLI